MYIAIDKQLKSLLDPDYRYYCSSRLARHFAKHFEKAQRKPAINARELFPAALSREPDSLSFDVDECTKPATRDEGVTRVTR